MANSLDKKNTVRQTRLEGVISLCKVNKTTMKNIQLFIKLLVELEIWDKVKVIA